MQLVLYYVHLNGAVMVDLDKIQTMWQEDAKIDDINLDKEALQYR